MDWLIVNFNSIPLIEIKLVISILFLLMAAITDYKTLKIPNWLTYSLISSVVILNFAGAPINKEQVIGLVLGFSIIFITAFIQGSPMGGDMKLVAGIGFLLGHKLMLQVLLISLLLGIPISLIHRYAIKDKKPLPFGVLLFIGELLIVLLNI